MPHHSVRTYIPTGPNVLHKNDNKSSMPVDLHVEASYASRIIKDLNSGLAGAGGLSVNLLRYYCLKPSLNNALLQLTPHCRPARFHCHQDPHLRCCPKSLQDTLYIHTYIYIYIFGKHGTTSRYGESVGLLVISQQERLDHRRRIRLGISHCSRMCKASVRESPLNHHNAFDEPCSAHVTIADIKETEGRAYQQKLKGEGLE